MASVPTPTRIAGFLRDAAWLTPARARAYARILLAIEIAIMLAWIATARGGLDLEGKPIGTDFLSFYAASALALAGDPARAYDVAAHTAAERAVFAGADTGYFAFFYPPSYLLVCLPLALLPYGAALAVWLGATGLAYWAALRRLLAGVPHATLAILAFPAVALCAGHGQNALLTTALFAAAVLCLPRRPILAGIAFGLLAFKPHLGLMIPVCLVAAGAWRTIAAAAFTVVASAAGAALAFGPGIYSAFLHASGLARVALQQDLVGAAKMQSVFAAVQLWHGPASLGWTAQASTAAVAALALVVAVRATADWTIRGAVLVCATLLSSPFLLDYDLTLLAIPLAVLWRRGLARGFRPWGKIGLAAGFVLPLVSRTLATDLGLPLGPPVVAAVLALVLREALASSRPEWDRRAVPARGLATAQ